MSANPAELMFEDFTVKLAGDRWQDDKSKEWIWTEVTLYVDYLFDDKAIRFAIYDSRVEGGIVLLDKKASNTAEAVAIAKEILTSYPKKLQLSKLTEVWDVFFSAAAGAVMFVAPLRDWRQDTEPCEACGTVENNALQFLFVPAVPDSPLTEPSLALHWNFDCYGGITILGAVDESLRKEALEVLGRMMDATEPRFQPPIRLAIDTIQESTR